MRKSYGTVYEDYPDSIAQALRRADAWWTRNELDRTFHIRSRNTEEPLTDLEKKRISVYLGLCMFPYSVVFDN